MKSGTTLLRTLLGQHPDLYSGFETHWYEREIRLGWNDATSKRMGYLLRLYNLDNRDYTVLCNTKQATPDREFIDIVLEFCAQRSGKPRWAEKTPGNIRHYRLIKRQWPSARFIHVTRDYKDCYASWKLRRGDSLDTFVTAVRDAYSDVWDLLGTTTSDYLEVDYGDLVPDTRTTMRRVLEFAEVPWDPACTSLDLESTQDEREKIVEVVGRDSHTNISMSKPIFTDAIGQWRDMLTNEEARRIERELDTYYAALGRRGTG